MIKTAYPHYFPQATSLTTSLGLSTEQEYNPATSHLFTIKSGFSPAKEIRSLEYEYDLMNNITQRQNHQSGLTEDFQYDQLDRLTQSNTTGTIEGVTYNNSTNFQYDINGNIAHKSDIGNYRYNAQKPHAIASINNNPSSTSSPSTDDYNANTTTTGMFTINSSVTGDIETANDKDWFKITLTAGQQVTFDLEGKPTQSGTLSDPYFRGIYDNTGTLIPGTTNDDGGIGLNSKITFTANTSNTYYISAGAYSNDTTTFTCAPNRSRYQKTQTKANSNTTITTTYIGKLYEQIKQNTSTEHKHFIYADGQLIAINIKTNTTANTPSIPDKTRYLHYDNLGSIDTITDGQGNIVERMAYTAFGQRRQGDWRASDPLLPIIPTLTNRGFTGHEHIDEMGFIHMNGRVYDPQIGRFLGADPTIQHPYNTQDYNRYSYATNNPLKYVDMNGFGWFSEARRNIANSKKCGRQITSIGVLFIFPGVNIYTAGFLSSMIDSKGDLKQGGLSAFTAGFNAGVLHPMKAGFGKLIAHGLTGGICSRLSGGSFKSGFLGSTISYGASWSGAYEAAGISSQA
ncbi:RHS repeat-associated core domain-containing protein, partial [Bathymodiolus thermophilus thioautotrophic gill symbiont]